MAGINVGLSIEDMDLLDGGMIFDLIIEYNNQYDKSKSNKGTRMATQEDFDKF